MVSRFSIAQKTIEKVLPEGIGETIEMEDQDPSISLKAAETAGIEQPFGDERTALHECLVAAGSDFITCLSAWALFLDLKSHTKMQH